MVLTDQLGSSAGLAFAYFATDGLLAASTTAVRYVEISLTLTQGSQPYNQRTRVELKNR